jgi:hypothetical protein
MICRKAPLQSGRETEIDMIEREMEGGVVVVQPLEVHEDAVESRLGGLVQVEEHVEVHEIPPKPSGAPKA